MLTEHFFKSLKSYTYDLPDWFKGYKVKSWGK